MDQRPVSRKGARLGRRRLDWLRRARGRPRGAGEVPLPPTAAERPRSDAWPRYGLAVALAVLAFTVEVLAARIFKPVRFFLFYPGAFLTTWLAGVGPAIAYVFLALVGTDVLFVIYEGGSLIPDAVRSLQMGLFAAFNLFATCLIWRGRRAEAALRDSERRQRIFRALVENSSDFIGIADPEGRPVYVNPAGRRMVGLMPDEPIEDTEIPEYYPPEERDFAQEVIVKEMVEKGRWSGETRFRHWRTQAAIPVLDEHFMIREPGNGEILGMGTVTRDITELKRAQSELEEARRFLSAVIENIPAMVVVKDARELRLTLCNKAGELILGRPREQFLGKTDHDLFPKEQADSFVSKDREALADGVVDIPEEPIQTPAGARFLHARKIPLRDAGGQATHLLLIAEDITERKKAEEDLRRFRERERFRLALEAAANAMITIDRRSRIIFLNEEAQTLFGWGREELIGQAVDVLIPERFRAKHARFVEGFFHETVAKRPMRGRDLRILRKDGREVPVEIGLARVEEGGEQFVVASITDISQRKRVEEERNRLLEQALSDLDAMTRLQRVGALSMQGGDLGPLLIEVVDAAIAISGADFGNIQILDPASGDLRIASQRGFPKWWLDYWNSASKGKGACGTALARGERVLVEDVEASPIFIGTTALEMQRKAGVRAVQSTPLLSRSGHPVGMFSTHYKTPRRPSDRALRSLDLLARQAADLIEQAQTQEAVRQSEQRYRLLIESTRDYGIFMHDLDNRVTVWSVGAERIFGYSAEEALGRTFHRFLLPEEVPKLKAVERSAVEKGSFENEGWRVRKDGARLWASIVTTPIFAPDGKLLGYGKVVRDLTERRRGERQIQESQDRLRQMIMELEAFAYTISHDLRAPLRAIEGYSHVLSERLAVSSDPGSVEMLGRIGRSAARLDRLIRDLLSYAAIGRQGVALEPVDLDEIIVHVARLYPELAQAKLRVRSPLGRAKAQPSLMIQVMANILTNAVKFRAAGRAPEIDVWTEKAAEGRLRVVIQDNGIGIPQESWERVFKPFERAHAQERYEGTGIGLAIVKRAIERMGGRVGLVSEPGKGSRFSVELPEA